MQLANPAAFMPFMQDDVVIRRARRDSQDDVVTLKAYVTNGNPYALAVGLASAAEQWSVAYRESDWKSTMELVSGIIIDADKMSNKFPRLTVQQVFRNGGLIILVCSGRERGVLK